MTGIPNQPITAAPIAPQAPVATPVQQPMPQMTAAPALTPDQLALTGQAPATPDLSALRMQLNSGSPAEAASALYQLKALAASNPQAALPLVIDQLGSTTTTTQLAALDILRSLHATQAASQIQQLALNASDPAVRAHAKDVYNALMPQTGGPAVGPGITNPQAAPGAAPTMDAQTASLITELLNPQTAPYAAVQLSKLPTPQMLAITARVLQSFNPDANTTNLIATILAKRPRDPGVADQLRLILQKDPSTFGLAQEQAALGLESLHNPAYLMDILRFLCSKDTTTAPVKRAIIDDLAKSPAALANPGTAAALAANLDQGLDDNLREAASHALGLTHSAQARDALANSPLFNSSNPQLRMRALWDLGQQPAPYPPIAMQNLKTLSTDSDAQVAALAKQLLAKKH